MTSSQAPSHAARLAYAQAAVGADAYAAMSADERIALADRVAPVDGPVDVSFDTVPSCDMPDGCGAAAGQPCEIGCPSLATDEAAAMVPAPESFRPVYWPSANTPAADRPIVQPLLDAGWTRRAGGQCGDPVPGGEVCRKLGAWGHPVHGEPGRPVCAPHALVRMTLG